MADDDDPTEPLPAAYQPFGGDYWVYAECEYGDLILETRWKRTDGLYEYVEQGEGPDSWGV